ncbi:MAG: outer membrane beta-barrel protein [bacterium]|nr:outer membrane beta-barrel protein [bacterium]
MKKTVMVALVAAVVASFTVNAHATKLMVGAKGGFNFADIHGGDADLAVPIKAFGLGAFGLAEVSEKFTVQLEALWMKKGAENKETKLTLELSYLEFPLTAVATVPVGDNAQIVGFAGPVLSYLVNADSEADKDAGGDGDVKDEVNTWDVGGTVGIGAWLTSGQMMFTVDLRWSFGFKKIGTVGPVEDLQNNVISIFGGVAFPIGR